MNFDSSRVASEIERRLPVRRVRFLANREKPRALDVRDMLASKASSFGLEVVPEGEADVVIALGGDGTILHAVQADSETPVLGLNLGGLGYLASVCEGEFSFALEMLAAGRFVLSERRLLAVRCTGEFDRQQMALNDLVVSHDQGGHALRLDLTVDGRAAARYLADGLIVATPTGSTAYSLAAGGPVLMPDSKSLVVTPLNPHALGVRPLVVPDSVRLTVSLCARTGGNDLTAGVYADGSRISTLSAGEGVEATLSVRSAKLVELEGSDPYDVLSRKLGWGSVI